MARRALDALYLGAGILAGCFLVAIAALMLLLSFGRQVGFNLRGGDDLTAWSLVAMSFLALAHTFKHGEMIRVGLLVERLPGRARQLLELAALTTATAFLGAFAWYAVGMVRDSWRFGEYAQGALAIPIWIPQTGLAAGVVILLIAFLDELVRVASGQPPTYVRAAPATAEEAIARAQESGV